jgi:hypothetical protein
MINGSLSRDQVHRRILDNLSWNHLPSRVIEPLPAVVAPATPPNPPVTTTDKPRRQPRSSAKRLVKKLLSAMPFLGKVARRAGLRRRPETRDADGNPLPVSGR